MPTWPMTPLPAFIPAYITAVVMTELITAYLLFVHTPLSRRFDLLWLAGAYLFSSAMAGGELAVLPGVLSLPGLFSAGPEGAVWIWVLWHGGFPAMVVAAMVVSWRQRHGTRKPARPRAGHVLAMAGSVLALATICVTLTAWFHGHLPVLVNGISYAGLAHSLAGWIVVALNLAALAICAAGDARPHRPRSRHRARRPRPRRSTPP